MVDAPAVGSGTKEVEGFLSSIGLENCVQAVVHNGFYTSMEALHGATYEELVDSGVRPVHAKLILSNLGSKAGLGAPLGTESEVGGTEVGHFLRSVGLENCSAELSEAGYTTLDALSNATLQDLLSAGLKPVHARLIVSNLDSASSAGINMTPAAQRLQALDNEDDGGEALLGGGSKRKQPKRARTVCAVLVAIALIFGVMHVTSAAGNARPPPPARGQGAHAGAHAGHGAHGGAHSRLRPAAAAVEEAPAAPEAEAEAEPHKRPGKGGAADFPEKTHFHHKGGGGGGGGHKEAGAGLKKARPADVGN